MLLLAWTACLSPAPPPAQGCADCHGSGGDPAPPEALGGSSDPTYRGVGAHQVHLRGTGASRPVGCAECHAVPGAVDAPGHLDDTPFAEVAWGGGPIAGEGASPYDAAGATCTVYCHGATLSGGDHVTVTWTEPGSAPCGACHGAPPPAPHPDVVGCDGCHPSGPETHVDGRVDVLGVSTPTGDTGGAATAGCAEGCHGTASSPAPPPDTSGSTDPATPGVGAHAAHLEGSARAAPIACATCHVVPATVGAPGHTSDDSADDTFSGVAVAGGRSPSWNAGPTTCSDTYCHDQGGAVPVPDWTSTARPGCGDCHGDPPPAPHPQNPACAGCHGHAGDDPDLHVDGTVQR